MKILLLNQCFYPDVVATAQYAGDLACALAGRGHQVTVVASRRPYNGDGPDFSDRETWNGCEIFRVPCLALGKHSKWRRALNFGSFFVNCAMRLVLLRRFDIVLSLTTPPLISFLGAAFVKIKGGRFLFWVMDLNPDEAVAAGWLRAGAVITKALDKILKISLRASESVIVLDRFMRDRIAAKGITADKIRILPLWSHNDIVQFDQAGREEFRRKHDLSGKFVIMYSGNHTPCHPLDTVLDAALAMRTQGDIAFCFVGGGSEYAKVKDFAAKHQLGNFRCLPYQPLAHLSASLSAADMHLVVVGKPFVGIVHASKIYNIMRVGAPVIYLGPTESHVADIASAHSAAPVFHVEHGRPEQLVNAILNSGLHTLPNEQIRLASRQFSQDALVAEFANLIESHHHRRPAADLAPEPAALLQSERPRSLAATTGGRAFVRSGQ